MGPRERRKEGKMSRPTSTTSKVQKNVMKTTVDLLVCPGVLQIGTEVSFLTQPIFCDDHVIYWFRIHLHLPRGLADWHSGQFSYPTDIL